MKNLNLRTIIVCSLVIAILAMSCSVSKQNTTAGIPPYKPASLELYNDIVRMDSIWGDSYNHCKTDVQDQIISEDLEFFHDLGGFLNSKTKLMNAYKNNICGKVTRELLKGSIEVYPIQDYGAVEMGYHRFHSIHDTGHNSHFARFVHIWRKKDGQWKITRVISLH